MLKICAPVRVAWSGDIVAVVEFYEVQDQLALDLSAVRRDTWLTILGMGIILGSILYVIVRGGSQTIDAQRRTLDARLIEMRGLSARNNTLRLRVQRAAARAATSAEATMRRIGADLHDGPAQDLAFAALRLDSLAGRVPDEAARADTIAIRSAVDNAMREVRAVSKGLNLPDIANRPLNEIVEHVIAAHRLRNATKITATLAPPINVPISDAVRICVFRFLQEGLNNASRHGGPGVTVQIILTYEMTALRLSIYDTGKGLDKDTSEAPGLGLSGLSDRVESLGGVFSIESNQSGGVTLQMSLDLAST